MEKLKRNTFWAVSNSTLGVGAIKKGPQFAVVSHRCFRHMYIYIIEFMKAPTTPEKFTKQNIDIIKA